MKKGILIFIFEITFIQCEYITNFNLQEFYFEYNQTKFTTKMINNPTSKEIISQLPIENSIIDINGLFAIPLNYHINIDISNSISILVKGNILTDGNYLFIYYGSNQINAQQNHYILAGNLINIDDLIDCIHNFPSFHLSFKLLCRSSIIMNENINISISNPSFKLFNKDSLYFEELPKLYFGSNNEPLYSNCKLNREIPFEINCIFNNEEIKHFYFLYPGKLNVFEIIPGCNYKIDTGLSIYFKYEIENCIIYDKNNKCIKCKQNKYTVSKDKEKCKISSFFYYMVIGHPIINITLLIIIRITFKKADSDNRDICLTILIATIFGLNLAIFLSYYLAD